MQSASATLAPLGIRPQAAARRRDDSDRDLATEPSLTDSLSDVEEEEELGWEGASPRGGSSSAPLSFPQQHQLAAPPPREQRRQWRRRWNRSRVKIDQGAMLLAIVSGGPVA